LTLSPEDNNTRVLFEKVLSTMPVEKARSVGGRIRYMYLSEQSYQPGKVFSFPSENVHTCDGTTRSQ